ncbi:MAG: DNA mismatch repair endonuclease MutL [Chloroflexi bacterium]|nr:DNA mismatch repair endonuclease MutL [Chloroflexota bacterium]
MAIVQLPPEVAVKIAAGEVVERPGSVAKELIENAIDAGASRIGVEVEDGGTGLIRVTDDGCGIPAAELELAFARHATSKLRTAADLEAVPTLGFRGEALAAIAAVAQVEIVTRAADEPVGVAALVQDGRIVRLQRRAWPGGTSIAVRSLFHNAPARLKFLRSPAAESAYFGQLLAKFALAYPALGFRLLMGGTAALDSPGGDLMAALVAVYGPAIARQLLPVDADPVGPVAVAGYVSPPTLSRPNRNHVTLSVNGRIITSRTLQHAVAEAYHLALSSGRHPYAILYIRLPPADLDVNVHPTKAEVRFRRDRQVFAEILRAVRGALSDRGLISAVTTPMELPATDTPAFRQPELDLTIANGASSSSSPSETEVRPPVGRATILRPVGQVNDAFIVAEGVQGIYLVDQHRAHERILYERILAARDTSAQHSQLLLEPEVVELTPVQAAALDGALERLAALGFTLERFGDRSCLVRAVPGPIRGGKPTLAPATVLRDVLDVAQDLDEHRWWERAAATIACRSAVMAGQTLSPAEMRELIGDFETIGSPPLCPHGSPTLLHLGYSHLLRQFGRS